MIYIDPTEGRENTRLHKSVMEHSTLLPGFEHATGADILITTYEKKIKSPKPEVANLVLQYVWSNKTNREIVNATGLKMIEVIRCMNFWKACQMGILIQRKTGRDFTSSIPDLNDILARMLKWNHYPWLLFVGDLKCSREYKAVIDGKNTLFEFTSVIGAFDAWQMRGGRLTMLSRDNLTMSWLANLYEKLRYVQNNPIKKITHRLNMQTLAGADWTDVLLTLPGIGNVKSQIIAEYCGSLARSLEWLSDPDSIEHPLAKKARLGGKTLENIRKTIMGKNELLNKIVIEAI